ncbi:MAG TPA: acVLRF1 family peptidyl-tRNA hydrolase [Kineosporiaceae bacterium]
MRTVQVDGVRLQRWCTRFAERHGGQPAVARAGHRLVLTAPDGSTAQLEPGFPFPDDVQDVPAAASWVVRPRRCAVLLVRRGGYACALLAGPRVVASKVGARYVQGRTAAGGWSQQRFARRRENQARGLVEAVADVAARLLLGAGPEWPEWLVTGGDRPLVADVLADRRLSPLAALRRGPHLALGDPRSDVVRSLPGLIGMVRIDLEP